MRLIVTGAAGRIATELIAELAAEHELRLVDRLPVAGHPSTQADLARRRGAWWKQVFTGADAVVHLAAEPTPRAPWRLVLRNNVRATWNVLEAATRHGVPRVVFASSHWAVRGEELARAPACYEVDGPKLDSNVAPRPVTPYGVSKGLGEMAGRCFVDAGQLPAFVAVRIGSFNPSIPQTHEERRRWLAPCDARALFRRCLEAELTGGHVVYGVCAHPQSPYDLSHTRRLLGWEPPFFCD